VGCPCAQVSDSESADEPPAVSPENWTSDGVVEFLDSIGMGAYRDNFKQFNGKSFSLLGEAHMEKLAGNAADGKLIYLRLQEAKRSGRSSAYSSSSQGAATTPLKYAFLVVCRVCRVSCVSCVASCVSCVSYFCIY